MNVNPFVKRVISIPMFDACLTCCYPNRRMALETSGFLEGLNSTK
jgi:hypothetical protein